MEKKLDKEETITLNINKFNDVMKHRKSQIEKFKVLTKFENGLQFIMYPSEIEREKKMKLSKRNPKCGSRILKRPLSAGSNEYCIRYGS